MNIIPVLSLCPKIVEALEVGNFTCEEIRYIGGQRQYVFKRDPWDEFEVIIAVGDSEADAYGRNDKFNEYCETGDVAS